MGVRTPDQRIRVFVSSTLSELSMERAALRRAIERLRLTPVMFELGARPHPPRLVYRSYLEQSDVFVGVYWRQYGWVAPDEEVSGLEDEYRLSGHLPRLIYVKEPTPDRDPRLEALLERVRSDDRASYKVFARTAELESVAADDIAVLLTERFHATAPSESSAAIVAAPTTIVPTPLTALVGRRSELAAIVDGLRRTRLLTLTGVGGVGKTRLAAEISGVVAPRHPDGVWWCDLAAASAPDLEAVVSTALGLVGRSGAMAAEAIADFLGHRSALVVLDNCEHVVDAAGRLAELLLQRCPGVQLLATSREGLAVDGEQIWPVPPLGRDDAVRLFVERARSATPDFAPDEEELGVIATLTGRLDGIPLAIELAAARIVALTPIQISALIDERFRLLSGGRRTSVDRHRTLRATLDWSYSLLTDPERLVFDRASVFVGSFGDGLPAVVGDGLDRWSVLDALTGLVAKSMVIRNAGPDGEGRYLLLETMRDYGLERLERAGQTDEVRRRHADLYAALAEKIGPELTGADEVHGRARLAAELDNLRAAVSWALDSPSPDDNELAVRIVAALAQEAVGGPSSGVGSWAYRAVPAARRSTPARRGAVLGAAVWWIILTRSEPFATARDLADEALLAWAPSEPDAPYLACAAGSILAANRADDDFVSRFEEAGRDLAGAGASLFARSFVSASFAHAALGRGEPERGRAAASEALELARASRNPSVQAMALHHLAAASLPFDPDLALRCADESIALTRAGASATVYSFVLALRAQVCAARGERAGALEALSESLEVYRDKGDLNLLGTTLDRGIRVLDALGEQRLAAIFGGFVAHGALRSLSTVPQHEIGGREQALAHVRSVLGQAAFDEATAHGAGLTPPEMTVLALRGIGELALEIGELSTVVPEGSRRRRSAPAQGP